MLSAEEEPMPQAEGVAPMEEVAVPAEVDETEPMKVDEEDDTESYKRYTALCAAMEDAAGKMVKNLTFETASNLFPWLAKRSPNMLRAKLDEVREQMRQQSLDDFRRIVGERDLERKLNELDEMVEKAIQRQNNGTAATVLQRISPEVAIRAANIPLKKAEIAKLRAQIQEMEASNAASVQELREGEQFIADTERELEVVQTQMREVSEVLGAVEASQLHNLVEELTGTTN